MAYLVVYRARLRFEQGQWSGASEDVRIGAAASSRTSAISRIPALRILGHLRIRRGDPDANSPLEEARRWWATPELQRVGTLAAIRAEAAWLAGDLDGMVREVQPAYELVCRRRDPRMKGELAAWLWRVHALDQPPTDIAAPYAMEISGDWRARRTRGRLWAVPMSRRSRWPRTELNRTARGTRNTRTRSGAAPAAVADAAADA